MAEGGTAPAVAWWKCVYYSEVLLLVPGLTWTTIRRTPRQMVVDLLRTVPLVMWIALVTRGHFRSLTALLVVGGYTLVLNVCMYLLDKKVVDDRGGPEMNHIDAHIIYLISLVSPTALLFGSPTFLETGRRTRLQYACCAVNLVIVAYLTVTLLFTYPFANAWACYQHPRNLADLKYGYCPQHSPHVPVELNRACLLIPGAQGGDNPRCDGTRYERSLHSEMSVAQHFAVHAGTVSIAIYLAQVPAAIASAEASSCAASVLVKKKV